jgi:Glyoxalase/Bleomycin resistance protein/Dioxygenase superfamily
MKIVKDIIQFAVVTPNTDTTVKNLCNLLNLGPLKVWDFKHPAIFDTTINDAQSPWTMKLAFGWLGNMQFEVIQPTGGDTLYQQYLTKWGHQGVQHVLIERGATSYNDMKKQLADAKTPIVNEAKSNVAVKIGPFTLPPLPMFLAKSMSTVFGYTNTLDTLKLVIETSKYPTGVKPRDGIRMGVPSYWSAGDQKNFETLPSNSLITNVKGFVVLVKNIDEAKPHYTNLFGASSAESSNKLMYALENNYLRVIQPIDKKAYVDILNTRGEGLQIIECTPRFKTKAENDKVFSQKGFEVITISDSSTLYVHDDMPFQILITAQNI